MAEVFAMNEFDKVDKRKELLYSWIWKMIDNRLGSIIIFLAGILIITLGVVWAVRSWP